MSLCGILCLHTFPTLITRTKCVELIAVATCVATHIRSIFYGPVGKDDSTQKAIDYYQTCLRRMQHLLHYGTYLAMERSGLVLVSIASCHCMKIKSALACMPPVHLCKSPCRYTDLRRPQGPAYRLSKSRSVADHVPCLSGYHSRVERDPPVSRII